VRVGLDHSPIMLSSWEGSAVGGSRVHFEKTMVLRPFFKEKC
jgi:hypothetical protein